MHPTPALQRALRRLPLTTKQGPHNYYKGNRTGAMGSHTKYGGYKIDYSKVRTYLCPDLTGFNVSFASSASSGAGIGADTKVVDAFRAEGCQEGQGYEKCDGHRQSVGREEVS